MALFNILILYLSLVFSIRSSVNSSAIVMFEYICATNCMTHTVRVQVVTVGSVVAHFHQFAIPVFQFRQFLFQNVLLVE